MNWRLLLITSTAALLLTGGYLLIHPLDGYMLVRRDASGKPGIIAHGWHLIPTLWPIALAGLLAGIGLAFSTALTLSHRTRDQDHAQQLKQARQRATNAEAHAAQQLQSRLAEAIQREQQASEALIQARQDIAHTRQHRLQADRDIAAAHALASEAEQRRKNAAATLERQRSRQHSQNRPKPT